MREYESREAAERDQELDLRIVWKCNSCGDEREEYPGCNEDVQCFCGGTFQRAGESYNA